MTAKVDDLSIQARKLTPLERAELVEAILQSLDHVSPETERKWLEEARDRLEAYRRGEVGASDFAEAVAKHERS